MYIFRSNWGAKCLYVSFMRLIDNLTQPRYSATSIFFQFFSQHFFQLFSCLSAFSGCQPTCFLIVTPPASDSPALPYAFFPNKKMIRRPYGLGRGKPDDRIGPLRSLLCGVTRNQIHRLITCWELRWLSSGDFFVWEQIIELGPPPL